MGRLGDLANWPYGGNTPPLFRDGFAPPNTTRIMSKYNQDYMMSAAPQKQPKIAGMTPAQMYTPKPNQYPYGYRDGWRPTARRSSLDGSF